MIKSDLPKCPICSSRVIVTRLAPSGGYYTAQNRPGYEVRCSIYCMRVEVRDGMIKNSVRDRERACRAWIGAVEAMKEDSK